MYFSNYNSIEFPIEKRSELIARYRPLFTQFTPEECLKEIVEEYPLRYPCTVDPLHWSFFWEAKKLWSGTRNYKEIFSNL